MAKVLSGPFWRIFRADLQYCIVFQLLTHLTLTQILLLFLSKLFALFPFKPLLP